MKKLFYLLLMLPFAFFASCNDDDDLPQVDLTLTLSGVTQYDNAFYAVQGDDVATGTEVATADDESGADSGESTVSDNVITIDGLTATSLTNQNAAVSNVFFFLDGRGLVPAFDEPYYCKIPTANLEVGTHVINVTANVLQVDKSIANAALNYPLVVVASADDLPDGAPAIGTYSVTIRNQSK